MKPPIFVQAKRKSLSVRHDPPPVPRLEVTGGLFLTYGDSEWMTGRSEVNPRDVKITWSARFRDEIMIRFQGLRVLLLIRLRPGANKHYSWFHKLPYLNSCRSFTYGVSSHSNEVP